MLSRDYLARTALRYDTSMSRAMLRALGVPVPHARAPRALDRTGESRKYRGARRLMAQRYGVKP